MYLFQISKYATGSLGGGGATDICGTLPRAANTLAPPLNVPSLKKTFCWPITVLHTMRRLVRAVLGFNTTISPQIDFCCFWSATHIALT